MRVLVVDDDPTLRFLMQGILESRGFEVATAETATDALTMLGGIDVVVSDYVMPDMTGMDLQEKIRAKDPALPFILITSQGSERLAVRALKQGAYDYLRKPFENDELSFAVERAAETRRLRLVENERALESSVGVRIVGRSPELSRVLDAAVRVAKKDVTVLLRGETGTGKELFASLLHANSSRAERALVVFNSAAIPPDLAESQLFGHAKGAFTGADKAYEGFFAQAHRSTLFIDEVGELPLAVQAKLLRVLQQGEVQALGSTQVKKVDVRIVAATHRDLAAEVKAGRFREDLYYRLNVVELSLPSLRERHGDIPLLAREFARKYSERFGFSYVVQLTPELVEALEQQKWPGNIRQLENTVARCIALATTRDLGRESLALPTESGAPVCGAEDMDGPTFREQMEIFERNLLRAAMRACGGNMSETARRLRLKRGTLYDKLKKYGLTKEEADVNGQ
jgi:two-component system response regulator AtoC